MTEAMALAVARARTLLGNGYIYGATGWVCSLARRQQQAMQYPDQASMILGTGAKWDGKVCWDCATFTREVAKAAGVTLPSGATSQYTKVAWAAKGIIDTISAGEPVFLYRQSGGVMQHTGFALGDGTCVHARGTAYGVLQQAMGTYAWTHWASPWASENKEEKSMEVLYQATVTATSGKTVRVRREPGGDVLGTLGVGAVVDVYAEVTGYCQIGYNGGTAYMQSAFLARKTEGATELAARISALETRVAALESK